MKVTNYDNRFYAIVSAIFDSSGISSDEQQLLMDFVGSISKSAPKPVRSKRLPMSPDALAYQCNARYIGLRNIIDDMELSPNDKASAFRLIESLSKHDDVAMASLAIAP
jgi:hypothetical protein